MDEKLLELINKALIKEVEIYEDKKEYLETARLLTIPVVGDIIYLHCDRYKVVRREFDLQFDYENCHRVIRIYVMK